MRSNLLSAAILAGIGIAATTTAAQAQSASDIADLKAQIAALQAKVAALDAQADAQSDINVQQAKANESLATTDALKKLSDGTKISGRMYYDLSNEQVTNAAGTKVDPSGTGFDIKRFYLGVDHKFDDVWAMNLTTDFQYNATLGASELYIKKAYVEGKFDPLFTVRAGASDMAWGPYVENLYGYRYVDKTLTDMNGLSTSADWGLHTFGATSTGLFNYAVSIVNGFGYKAAPDNGTNNRSKTVDFEGRIGFQPITGLNIGVGAYSGKKGKDTYANAALNTDASTTNNVALQTASRTDAVIAYANSSFRLGAEWFQSKNYANPLLAVSATGVTAADIKEDGYSIFGNVNLTASGIAVFARYDELNTDKNNALDPKQKFYNVGVEFPIVKGVKIAPVYKDTKKENTGGTQSETKEFGAFGEFRF